MAGARAPRSWFEFHARGFARGLVGYFDAPRLLHAAWQRAGIANGQELRGIGHQQDLRLPVVAFYGELQLPAFTIDARQNSGDAVGRGVVDIRDGIRQIPLRERTWIGAGFDTGQLFARLRFQAVNLFGFGGLFLASFLGFGVQTLLFDPAARGEVLFAKLGSGRIRGP